MEFGRLLRLVENSPYANTQIWNPKHQDSWNIDDTMAKSGIGTSSNLSGSKNQIDTDLYKDSPKFVGFVSWYHHNRGNWNDVIAMSQQDPEVKALVDQAQQEFNQSSNPTASGDGLFGKFGDQLEQIVDKKMVEKGMGNHKYPQPRSEKTSDGIISGSPSDDSQSNGSISTDNGIAQRLSSLEQSYSDLLQQLNDLKRRLAQ